MVKSRGSHPFQSHFCARPEFFILFLSESSILKITQLHAYHLPYLSDFLKYFTNQNDLQPPFLVNSQAIRNRQDLPPGIRRQFTARPGN